MPGLATPSRTTCVVSSTPPPIGPIRDLKELLAIKSRLRIRLARFVLLDLLTILRKAVGDGMPGATAAEPAADCVMNAGRKLRAKIHHLLYKKVDHTCKDIGPPCERPSVDDFEHGWTSVTYASKPTSASAGAALIIASFRRRAWGLLCEIANSPYLVQPWNSKNTAYQRATGGPRIRPNPPQIRPVAQAAGQR